MTEDRAARVLVELDKALEVLGDEFNAGIAGPSGLRSQAIAHVRQARVLLKPQWRQIREGVWMPEVA